MGWQGMENRRFPRAHYACIVRVRIKGGLEVFQTETENIGCGGVCVILPKGLTVFSNVELELDFQEQDKKIVCDGKIVWVVRKSQIVAMPNEEFDTGIEFINVRADDKAIIEVVVNECLKKSISTQSAS